MTPQRNEVGVLPAPPISREPLATLPARLLAAGYKYRRLICWNYACFDTGEGHEDDWELMKALASDQGEWFSWELVNDPKELGSWHVSGYQPVAFESQKVLLRELALEES